VGAAPRPLEAVGYGDASDHFEREALGFLDLVPIKTR
jgi:hypothetical protein